MKKVCKCFTGENGLRLLMNFSKVVRIAFLVGLPLCAWGLLSNIVFSVVGIAVCIIGIFLARHIVRDCEDTIEWLHDDSIVVA